MEREPPSEVDCLVVGGGPGGLTATLYLRRFHRRVLLVDAGKSRALRIDRTRNMPGFPDGIAGPELLARLRRQVAGVHGAVTEAEVQALEHDGRGGFIALVDGRQLTARQVVLATGVVDHEPPLPGLQDLRERGLLRHCPICDAYEHSGERILVLGDGPHAWAEAAFLSHFSPHVTLLGVREEAREQAREEVVRGEAGDTAPAEVACLPSRASSVAPLPGGGLVVQTQDGARLPFDVLYMAMGVTPRNGLALPLGSGLDDKGNLAVDSHCRTSVPGLYAIGDVVGGLDQLSVATAQGAIAATAVHNSL